MIRIGGGLGVGSAPAVASSPPAVSNLLRWTEEFDNAVWSDGGSGVVVTANAGTDPLGGSTADLLVFAPDAILDQVSLTASTTGGAVSLGIIATTSWVRYQVSGTFDGLAYTLSLHVRGVVGGEALVLRLARASGALAALLVEDGSVGCAVFAWGAQLEQAASASTYQSRTT